MPGICVLGDRSKNVFPHAHINCPRCPHMCTGPSITASANVYVGSKRVMRFGDQGIHDLGLRCCGPNTWEVIVASGGVLVNGAAIVRNGDSTKHCGVSFGQMITGSG